jgi:phage N-6-adenine-methyltransferase
MTPEDAEEYTQSLGQVVGGSWRMIALAQRLGVPRALGLGTREWVAARLGGYLRLSIEDRRQAVLELAGEGMSQRQIADVLGVGRMTVGRDLGVPDGTEGAAFGGWEPQVSVPIGTPQEPPPRVPGQSGAGTGPGGEAAAAPAPAEEPDAPAASRTPHVCRHGGGNEWYTPPECIAAAVEVLGGIDLDPASSAAANEVVGAERYYTAAQDGLTRDWAGRVWMNPPYGQPLVDRFCARLAREFAGGAVEEAIALVNNATETAWFQALAAAASAICFPRGRIRFRHPDRPSHSPLQGQAVVYLGPRPGAFCAVFRRFGLVAEQRASDERHDASGEAIR